MNTTTTTGTTSRTYLVAGMTCDHCVVAVREEIGNLDPVTGVMDLASGGTSRVTVTSVAAVPDDQVRAAVVEAGSVVVGAAATERVRVSSETWKTPPSLPPPTGGW